MIIYKIFKIFDEHYIGQTGLHKKGTRCFIEPAVLILRS